MASARGGAVPEPSHVANMDLRGSSAEGVALAAGSAAAALGVGLDTLSSDDSGQEQEGGGASDTAA